MFLFFSLPFRLFLEIQLSVYFFACLSFILFICSVVCLFDILSVWISLLTIADSLSVYFVLPVCPLFCLSGRSFVSLTFCLSESIFYQLLTVCPFFGRSWCLTLWGVQRTTMARMMRMIWNSSPLSPV